MELKPSAITLVKQWHYDGKRILTMDIVLIHEAHFGVPVATNFPEHYNENNKRAERKRDGDSTYQVTRARRIHSPWHFSG